MTPAPRPSAARELAAATSALVRPYVITDILADMLRHSLSTVGAEAAAILVLDASGQLEVLSSSSHAAALLEIYQAQTSEGPCLDCISIGQPVEAHGAAELESRWSTLGPAILRSGFHGVLAQPMLWHGRALGGLNLFFEHAQPLSDDARAFAQSFADIATLALVQTQRPSDRELAAHIRDALDGRTMIEHAKGVLMHRHGLDPDAAYDTLLSDATREGLTVTEVARSLVWGAQSR